MRPSDPRRPGRIAGGLPRHPDVVCALSGFRERPPANPPEPRDRRLSWRGICIGSRPVLPVRSTLSEGRCALSRAVLPLLALVAATVTGFAEGTVTNPPAKRDRGYAYVHLDVRGTGRSGGEYGFFNASTSISTYFER